MLSAVASGKFNGTPYVSWSVTALGTAVMVTFIMGLLLFPIYLFVSWLFVYVWTVIAGRYWLNGKRARAAWPELEGYRIYLKQVDIDNIQSESTDTSHAYVTRTLPYAMIFCLDTKWRERIKNSRAA